MSDATPILELERVRLSYMLRAGEVNVTPDLSLRLERGEALGLVGESGSGKSTIAFTLVRYMGPLGRIMSGRILFEGRDIAAMSEAELRALRGKRIAMVYQDPMSSLNPVMTIGRQLMEVPMLHESVGAEVRRFFGPRVYDTIIPRSVRLAEAPSHGKPITLYDPTSRGAQAYQTLAQEVIARGRQPSATP